MRNKRVLLFTFLFSSFFATVFSLEIKKNEPRVLAVTANDKFTYGLSQNKDDQLTATTELHFILPCFFIDINDNSITNRFFPGGRYDELIIKAGTSLKLFNTEPFEIVFTPLSGFCFLGNFGMGFAQNMNHQISCVDEVVLEYEHFEKPFSPVFNAAVSFSYKPMDFVKLTLDLASNNAIFYTTDQSASVNATFGNKTTVNIFTGYKWNQTHASSTALKAYKDQTKGFNYGFNIDTGLFKFDFITYPQSRNGLGSICMDFMNFKNHNWERSDLNFYTGLCYFINTEFLETQIESKIYQNFSIYLNNKYVSGFKTNKVNPSPYRYERDYETMTVGLKYEQPLTILNNWITPYVEVGTGAAMFGLQKLAYHLPNKNSDVYKYDTKDFWQIEANIGLDIFPQGMLNFGNATYSLTVYAGTIFIPDSARATKQIKLDTYRTTNWQLHPFEFKWGFALHMGLDF